METFIKDIFRNSCNSLKIIRFILSRDLDRVADDSQTGVPS